MAAIVLFAVGANGLAHAQAQLDPTEPSPATQQATDNQQATSSDDAPAATTPDIAANIEALPPEAPTVAQAEAPQSEPLAAGMAPAQEATGAPAQPAPATKSEKISTSNGLAIGAVVTLILVLGGASLAVIGAIARRTYEKYEYRVFLNAWNLIYVVVLLLLVGAFFAAANGVGAALAVLLPALGLLAFRAAMNVRNTSLKTGLAISAIQTFCILPGLVAVWLIRGLMVSVERDRQRQI